MPSPESLHWRQNYLPLDSAGLINYSFLTNFEINADSQLNRPVICLHGWLDNAASFFKIAPYLNHHSLILPELAGHGYSSHRPLSGYYHLIDWVYDLWRFIDKLNIQSCILVGHSIGGMISSILAAILPAKVEKLVLLESSAAFTSNPQALVENIKAAFVSRNQVTDVNLKKKQRSIRALPALIETRAKVSEFDPTLAALLMERNIERSADYFTWLSDPRLKTLSPIRLDDDQAQAYIEAIEADCLAVLAEQGYPSIARALNRRKTSFKQIKIKTMAGGHHFHMQDPEKCALLIEDFIQNKKTDF